MIFFICACIMFSIFLWQGILRVYRLIIGDLKSHKIETILAIAMVVSTAVTSIGLGIKLARLFFPT